MKVVIYGANGVMGKKLIEVIDKDKSIKIIARVDPFSEVDLNSLNGLEINTDIVIDFSHPSNLEDILSFAIANESAVLLCTTGYTKDDFLKIEDAAKVVPILQAGNTSTGIAVLKVIVKKAAEMVPNWDFEVVEAHHNRKIDSPSGTAEEIIKIIQGEQEGVSLNFGRNPSTGQREPGEIGIHSIRAGSIVGDHTVIFAGDNEIIEVKHKAISRDLFASGAIQLAKFLIGRKPGLYSVADAY